MKKILLLLFGVSAISFAQVDSTLILSEIMFRPPSGPNEFVELHNFSATESIDLSGYKFKYSTASPDQFIDAGFGTTLPPGSFAIIFENDYDIANGIYNNLVPPNALILKIDNNSFGSSGMANTADRPVWLINTLDDTLDAYFYSANNGEAISDEKITLNKDSSQSNWANSLVTNGTPGFTNSVTPLQFDLQLSSLTFSPSLPVQGDDVEITAELKNIGTETASSYSVEIFNDVNQDSIPQPGEQVFIQNYNNLASGDSIEAVTTLFSLLDGIYQVIARVNFAQDKNLSNNQLIDQFRVFPPGNNFNDVVINEIMYAPLTGEPEWVELYNRTNEQINLNGWTISDAAASVSITNEDKIIEPNSFIVVTSDSSILNFYNVSVEIIETNLPILNNSGDVISINDSIGVLIDSLFYLSSWGGNTNGRSLERIDPDSPSTEEENWGTSMSLNKATPGIINSLTQKDNDLTIKEFTSFTGYGIVGEQTEFEVEINNIGTNPSSSFTVELYNDVNQDSIPQSSEFVSSQQGNSLSAGDSSSFIFATTQFAEGENYFITYLDVFPDDDTTNNIAFEKLTGVSVNEVRNDIVINEIMYSPFQPEPEWIEIVNRSSKVINLQNYQLADAGDTVKVIEAELILNPDEYLVLAKDSLILSLYNIPSQTIIHSFPALNNSGDKVILLDSLNRVIDSLAYTSQWGGTDDKSIERVSTENSSTDSTNWKTSENIFGATPGFINSVTQKNFDIAVSDIIFNPPFPLEGEQVNVSAKVSNKGLNNALFSLKLFEDTNLDSIPDLLLETLSSLSLSAGDSSVYDFSYLIDNLTGKRAFYIKAEYAEDQDTTNNFRYETIAPGFPPNSVVINEIMYSPAGGEPEWIELYNRSEFTINLLGWKITDVITFPVTAEIEDHLIIEPGEYIVLTNDSSIINYHRFIPGKIYKIDLPSFNNDSDGIILKDDRELTIDSVLYTNQWGGTNGYSLERISPEISSTLQSNWSSSEDLEQSTPGRINSVTPKSFDLSIVSIGFSPRFPVPGDDVSITAKIKNNGSSNTENFSVRFLIDTDQNNEVDLLLEEFTNLSLNSLDSLSLITNNKIQNLTFEVLAAVRIVYSNDEDTLNNYAEASVQPGEAANIIVINEVKYDPAEGEPEWIEFKNISTDSINIQNWLVSDVLSTPTQNFITSEETFINPGEFFIIAKDTSFNSVHSSVTAKKFYVNFGTLGNSEDGVILYDFREGIIDSLLYDSDWGGRNGLSLERISTNTATNDSTNWVTSLDPEGSTPGRENSVINIPDYNRNDVVINEIMFDPATDNSEFIEFLNISSDTINIGGWRIEDENGNLFRLTNSGYQLPPDNYFLLIADSAAISYYSLENFSNKNIAGVSSLGLSNSRELVLLKDVKGNTIDSVFYDDNWQNRNIIETKNRSLERINPLLGANDLANWSTSVSSNGASPGKQNSIYAVNLDQSSDLTVSPNPFSPDNDGFEDNAIINYKLSQPTAQVRIKIFDSKGRLVRTLLNNQASGSSGSVIFDGLDEDGDALRIGIYIIFLEALNDNSGVVETMKTVVVVARKLG